VHPFFAALQRLDAGAPELDAAARALRWSAGGEAVAEATFAPVLTWAPGAGGRGPVRWAVDDPAWASSGAPAAAAGAVDDVDEGAVRALVAAALRGSGHGLTVAVPHGGGLLYAALVEGGLLREAPAAPALRDVVELFGEFAAALQEEAPAGEALGAALLDHASALQPLLVQVDRPDDPAAHALRQIIVLCRREATRPGPAAVDAVVSLATRLHAQLSEAEGLSGARPLLVGLLRWIQAGAPEGDDARALQQRLAGLGRAPEGPAELAELLGLGAGYGLGLDGLVASLMQAAGPDAPALIAVARALPAGPEATAARLALGAALRDQADDPLAAAQVQRLAADRAPGDAAPWLELAASLRAAGEPDAAAAALERAVLADPGHGAARLNRAIARAAAGDAAGARADLALALAADPGFAALVADDPACAPLRALGAG